MAVDLTIAVILGIVICGTACALVAGLFWLLWRRKDTTGSFYMSARRSTVLMDAYPLVETWKNGSDPVIQREPSRLSSPLWKNTSKSGSQTQSSSQDTHSRNTSGQSSHRPDMSIYPSGRRAVDQLRNMEITDPSGILQPHELEACMPSELDGATSMPPGLTPWTGRMLSSETNSPAFMRKASLRTRRAEKQSRNSGFFVPRPSSLGMRRLDKAGVDAELAAVRASSEASRSVNPSPATVSPMNTASMRHGSNVNTPLRSAVSQESHDFTEFDAESPRRRASFSSWRQTKFDVVAPPTHNPRDSCLRPEWCPGLDIHSQSWAPIGRTSELSGESIMRRSSIWVERESFPPRLTRSLDIPRTNYQLYQRPVVVMNSPTESSAYNDTNADDSECNSKYEEESDDDGNDTETEDPLIDVNAPWSLPPMTLYSPALTRERWISPLPSPAVFNNADSPSPASTPRQNKVSPLPSPHFQNKKQQHSASTELLAPTAFPGNGGSSSSSYVYNTKQHSASAEFLAPTIYTGGGKESPTVHYPSWSEVSGFDFVKKSMEEAGEDGEDGWRPVPDSAAGRYELGN